MSILDLSLYQETENLSPQQKKFNRQIQKIEKLQLSLVEWQQAQQKVQQDARVELLPLYAQWHQVLFSQLEVLWQYKQSHKFAKTHLERLDKKISILVSQLLNNPNLSEEQHKLTIVIAQFYKILEDHDHLPTSQVDDTEDDFHSEHDVDEMMEKQVMKEILADQLGVSEDWIDFDFDLENLEEFMQKVKEKFDREEADFIQNQLNDHEREAYQKFAEKQKKKILKKQMQLEDAKKMAGQSLKSIYLKIASVIHPDRERDEQKRIEKTELLQQANTALEEKDLLTLLKLRAYTEQGDQKQAVKIANEHLKSYNLLLEDQIEQLQMELDHIIYSFDWKSSGFYKHTFKPADLAKKYQYDLREIRRKLLQDEQCLNNYKDFDCLKNLLKNRAFGWSFNF